MVEESAYFGPFLTVIDGTPLKIGVNYQQLRPDFGDPSGEHPYYYHFNADPPILSGDFIVNSTSTLFEYYFKNNLKEFHFSSIKFGISKLREGITYGKLMYTPKEYEVLSKIPALEADTLRHAILEFISCVNGTWPREQIEADDIQINCNAKTNDIDQWLESLAEEGLLERKRKDYVPNRFGKGHRGLNKYGMKQEKRDEIKKQISQTVSIIQDFDIDINNIQKYLNCGESEILELKGSLELDIKGYLNGDHKKVSKKELNIETLRTLVGFLNSNENSPRHLVIGLLEKDKFGNINQYKEISPNLLLFGINYDYKKNGWDGYQLKLRDLIKSKISDSAFQYLKMSRITIDDSDLCLIKIFWPSSVPSKWFYLNKTEFWVRDGNRTRRLEGEAADDYKKNNPRG